MKIIEESSMDDGAKTSLLNACKKVDEELTIFRSAMQKSDDALRQSLEDLRAAQTQLIQSEKMATLGELTSGIAHEIQNPLNFINNFAEVNSELADEITKELALGNTGAAKELLTDLQDNNGKICFHGIRAASIVKVCCSIHGQIPNRRN
ncbi:MAG: hypothetical protein IPL46_22330 [Saprospiraceae bacterium]|nr:hypothetical protein [Saprospiraceae bacterium]